MKRKVAILLIAAVLLSLSACSSKKDEFCGLYKARWATTESITVPVSQIYENGFSVELQEGGKAVLTVDGEEYRLKWERDGANIRIDAADTSFFGTIADGVMALVDFQDSGVDFTLVCDELVKTSPRTEYWNGRWYGWRIIYSGFGAYANSEDMAEDVLADIEVIGNRGYINVWSFDQSENEPLINAAVRVEDGVTDLGKLVVQEGYAYGVLLDNGELEIDPGASTVKSLDHMIEIAGLHVDPDNEENRFEYHYFLRPWGMTWEDVETAESEDFLYADMMPSNYEDWYLIEIGVKDEADIADAEEDEEEFDLDEILEEFEDFNDEEVPEEPEDGG